MPGEAWELEESFLDLLLANNHVLEMLEKLKGPQISNSRRKKVIMHLKSKVEESTAYAEEVTVQT